MDQMDKFAFYVFFSDTYHTAFLFAQSLLIMAYIKHQNKDMILFSSS